MGKGKLGVVVAGFLTGLFYSPYTAEASADDNVNSHKRVAERVDVRGSYPADTGRDGEEDVNFCCGIDFGIERDPKRIFLYPTRLSNQYSSYKYTGRCTGLSDSSLDKFIFGKKADEELKHDRFDSEFSSKRRSGLLAPYLPNNGAGRRSYGRDHTDNYDQSGKRFSSGLSQLVGAVESIENSDADEVIPGLGNALIFTASLVRRGREFVEGCREEVGNKCDKSANEGKDSLANALHENGILDGPIRDYIEDKVGVKTVIEIGVDEGLLLPRGGVVIEGEAGIRGVWGVGVYGGNYNGEGNDIGWAFSYRLTIGSRRR